MEQFAYPAQITPDEGGGFMVRFRDLPEAITSGQDRADAIEQAADCLQEALAGRLVRRGPIPEASKARRGDRMIPVAMYLAPKLALFAQAMRRVDPTIKLIASGAMPDAMTGSKQAKRISGKIVPDYLSPADWSGGMLAHCLENMDLISEHFYSYNNQRFEIATRRRPGGNALDHAARAENT